MFRKPLNSISRLRSSYWISLIGIYILLLSNAAAQSSADIKSKQKQLKKEIALTQKNLALLNKDKSLSLARYDALRKQVKSRNELIENYQLEVDLVEADLIAQEADITLTKLHYDAQKTRFQDAIKNYYKIRNAYRPVSFILSSNSFTTAWQRLIFYRGLSRHHKSELGTLKNLEENLLIYIEELKVKKTEKENVLADLINQKNKLSASQKTRQIELAKLKKNEAFLNKRLQKQEGQAQKLSLLLTKLVEASIKKSKSKSSSPTATKLNPAFGNNKGKLPWPVDNGYVGKRFGKQRHPDLKMIMITNNGIDIITEPGSAIQAVFDGTVTAIQSVVGFQQTILINHGGYYTVYANVDNLKVERGDKVKRGEAIATVAESEDGASIHFELWKGKALQNPSTWLLKK